MYLIVALFFFFLSVTSGRRLNAGLNRFKDVIIFGDSYSDTGNVYKLSGHTWPVVPPYYQGRFCDGPIWVDKLEALEKTSYAYSGATTNINFVQGFTKQNTLATPGFRQQIDMYLNDTANQNIDFDRTLYIVWLGGNDYGYDPSATATQVVNSFMTQIRYLLANGAKNLLIFNQIPIQLLPAYNKPTPSAYFTSLVTSANNAILTSLANIQQNNTQASIYMFDINALITNTLLDNSSTTFTDKVDVCWINYNLTAVQILCPDSSKYFFLTDLQFSTTVHQLIIDAINPFLLFTFNKGSSSGYIRFF